MLKQNSFCSYCGTRFPPDGIWPRKCSGCNATSYLNPLPVVVILVPLSCGLVVIRRNIEPQKGWLALPGGYIDLGETWQEAGRREVFEETGIEIDSREIRLYDVMNGLDGTLVIFGLAAKVTLEAVQPFQSEETQEVLLIDRPMELAFSMHSRMVRRYFDEIATREDQ